jgi:hypothetical protein
VFARIPRKCLLYVPYDTVADWGKNHVIYVLRRHINIILYCVYVGYRRIVVGTTRLRMPVSGFPYEWQHNIISCLTDSFRSLLSSFLLHPLIHLMSSWKVQKSFIFECLLYYIHTYNIHTYLFTYYFTS